MLLNPCTIRLRHGFNNYVWYSSTNKSIKWQPYFYPALVPVPMRYFCEVRTASKTCRLLITNWHLAESHTNWWREKITTFPAQIYFSNGESKRDAVSDYKRAQNYIKNMFIITFTEQVRFNRHTGITQSVCKKISKFLACHFSYKNRKKQSCQAIRYATPHHLYTIFNSR
jgi:hypothetical protein